MAQVFLLIEILWPILLFAVLVGLRSKFPPIDMPECKYYMYIHVCCVCIQAHGGLKKQKTLHSGLEKTQTAGIHVHVNT